MLLIVHFKGGTFDDRNYLNCDPKNCMVKWGICRGVDSKLSRVEQLN